MSDFVRLPNVELVTREETEALRAKFREAERLVEIERYWLGVQASRQSSARPVNFEELPV